MLKESTDGFLLVLLLVLLLEDGFLSSEGGKHEILLRSREVIYRYTGREKLDVYQLAISFVGWCEDILLRCEGRASAKQHLDEASTSIPLNIAEGNGKWSKKDRRKYFEIARASALESGSCLDVSPKSV